MKIFELVKPTTSAITTPGNVVAPVGPGVKPSGDTPVPTTEKKPETSNTPNILQPNAQGALAKPMGADTSKPVPNTDQQDQPAAQTTTQQPAPNATSTMNPQELKSQMQALMMKLQQIQQQEPPPESENPQPGVSG